MDSTIFVIITATLIVLVWRALYRSARKSVRRAEAAKKRCIARNNLDEFIQNWDETSVGNLSYSVPYTFQDLDDDLASIKLSTTYQMLVREKHKADIAFFKTHPSCINQMYYLLNLDDINVITNCTIGSYI